MFYHCVLFTGIINLKAKWFQLFKTLTQKINRRYFALWILLEDNRSTFCFFFFFEGKWIVKHFCLIFKSFKMYVCLVRLRSTAFFSWFRSSRHTIRSAQALLRSVTRFNCVTQNVNCCGLLFNLPLPWAIHHKTQLVSNKLSRRHSLSLNHSCIALWLYILWRYTCTIRVVAQAREHPLSSLNVALKSECTEKSSKPWPQLKT